MKKLLTLVSVLTLVFTSCSSDDSPSTPILVAQIIVNDGANSYTANYNYNGTKVVSIVSSDGDLQEYTYIGDLITKIKYSNSNNSTSEYTESLFEYNTNGKIISQTNLYHSNNSYGSKSVYVYNSDITISYNFYLGDLNSQTNLQNAGKLFLNTTGEIYKLEEYDFDGNITEQYNFTFDTQNNPAINITGYNNLPFHQNGKNNNILTSTSLGGYSSDNYSIQYQYNSNGHPTLETTTYGNGAVETTQYFYNQ